MDFEKAKRTLEAASGILLTGPDGTYPLSAFNAERADWLGGTKGMSQELKAARLVRKLLMEIETLNAKLKAMGLVKKQAPAAAAPQPAPAAVDVAQKQLALVPYVPSEAPRAKPPAKKKEFENETAQKPWKMDDFIVANIITVALDFVWPYVFYAKVAWRIATFLPLALHALFILYVAMAGWHVAQHPELIVQFAFGILDLVPNYASYATERVTSQISIEVAKRFR